MTDYAILKQFKYYFILHLEVSCIRRVTTEKKIQKDHFLEIKNKDVFSQCLVILK